MTVPQRPHGTPSVAPGVGQLSSAQVPLVSGMQLAVQSASRLWPLGHPSLVRYVVPGAQSPSLAQVPVLCQLHVASHVSSCVPQLPHVPLRVAPGAHSPVSFMQGPYCQLCVASQKRVTEPHMPQAAVSVAPGVEQGPASGIPASVVTLVSEVVNASRPTLPSSRTPPSRSDAPSVGSTCSPPQPGAARRRRTATEVQQRNELMGISTRRGAPRAMLRAEATDLPRARCVARGARSAEA